MQDETENLNKVCRQRIIPNSKWWLSKGERGFARERRCKSGLQKYELRKTPPLELFDYWKEINFQKNTNLPHTKPVFRRNGNKKHDIK